MKKIPFFGLILLFAVSLLACHDERTDYPALQNHWVLVNQSSGDKLLTLTFSEDEMEVRHANHHFPPLNQSRFWDYWVEGDSLLVIGYSETTDYDDDRYTQYHQYELPFTLSPDGNHLTLRYGGNLFCPNVREYQFLRR